ncbi:MAG: caspase family protein [Candidatus Nanoarchaeia archaeon]|nr:caspase family protein [Candidatus Nanoarchaeia archaeon]
MDSMGKILLLCIGINKYPNLPDRSLKYSVKDANLIFEGYAKYNCAYKNCLTDSNATKENILKAINDISSKARDTDYLILSFAGHGFAKVKGPEQIDSNNCFICPYNFDAGYSDITGISLNEINIKIKQINSKQKLLLLDACHSGSALRRDIGFNFRDINTQELLNLVISGSGNGTIAACDSNEAALEDDKLEQGIFTHAFNKILSNEQEDNLDFKEAYAKICEEVKGLTQDKQHPKSKCDDDSLIIPRIPKNALVPKGIDLDLSILPIQIETKLDKIDEFEDKIIYLIQNNKTIELDKTLKHSINQAYNRIGELISPPHKTEKEEVIAIYESCRNSIKPIILILDYLLDYGDESIILDNLDLIFRFEELSQEMSGLTAIIQIPSTLIAEIIFKVLGKAHKKRYSRIIRKFFNLSSAYFSGMSIPYIYNARTWHPEMFHGDVKRFFEYLYPPNKYNKDIILKQEIRELCEIIFLIDSYSIIDNRYTSFPIYLYLDNGITKIILNNLSDKKFKEYINEIFNIDKNDLIDVIVERQKEISTWSDNRLVFWHSQDYNNEFIKLKQ